MTGNSASKCEKCKSGKSLGFEISMAFQPIVNLQNFDVFGYEALVRTPENGGAAEVFKHVNKDNLYLFDQKCRKKAIQVASELNLNKFLSINFMPNAVYEPSRCIQTTLRTAAELGFPLDLIIFEFTEHEEIKDIDHLSSIVKDYQSRGFLTAIDDFGAGFSGLNLLSQVTVDMVKIDRMLIKDIDLDPRRIRILRGLKSLLFPVVKCVVVEGVETLGELKCLYGLGFRHFQGYYFAKPGFESLPEVDFVKIRKDLGEKRYN